MSDEESTTKTSVRGTARATRVIDARLTPMPGRRWTQSDIAQLRALLASGGKLGDAAVQLDRKIDDVRALAVRLRLRPS